MLQLRPTLLTANDFRRGSQTVAAAAFQFLVGVFHFRLICSRPR